MERVAYSVTLYGLNLPRLVEARKRAMREIHDQVDNLIRDAGAAKSHPPVADSLAISEKIEQIRRKTLPCCPYSRAARAQLVLDGFAELCAQPEDGQGMAGAGR